MTHTPLRVVIADDHGLFRDGLKSLLKLQAEVEVVGEAENLDELARILQCTSCDVLLLDLGMERNSIVDIAGLAERVRVVVVTASELPADALDAMRSGASAVVLKRFAGQMLMDAIRTVAAGQVWMPPSLQAHLLTELREAPQPALTRREREVIREVALGLRNAEVARKLFVSEQTVKTHLNNVFQKLGIRDRTELTLYAARVGIIGLHERSR